MIIAGPEGLKDWFVRVMETAFPGASKTNQKFKLDLIELKEGTETYVGEIKVMPFRVHHGNPEGPFFALRVGIEGKTIAYTGDTQWTDKIIDAAKSADLFVAEAYFRDKQVPFHLDLATLERHLPEIDARRVVLTHMSDDMLQQVDDLPFETAEDGMVLEI